MVHDEPTPISAMHPDPDVDVAVVFLNVNFLQEQGLRLQVFVNDSHTLTRQQLNEQGITEGDGVFVLGFPMGMVGGEQSVVTARTGCVARIRDFSAGTTVEFLVDAQVFPGNSGSPVVLRPEAMSIVGTQSHNASSLVGIVKSCVPYQDVAISAQTGRPRVIFEENTGLAAVHGVDAINETISALIESMPRTTPPPTEEVTSPPNT